MIGLKEFMVNEVSSELLMKAAKKAKEVGDPRVEKFFNAAVEKAKKELDNIEVDMKKVAENKTKKTFDKLKKLGKPAFGFGSNGMNQLFLTKNERDGMLLIYTGGKGIIPVKGMMGADELADFASSQGLGNIADKLKDKADELNDEDQIIFVKFILANDKSIKGPEIYRNCHCLDAILLPSKNTAIGGAYVEYIPDGKNHPCDLDFDIYKLKDKDLLSLVGDTINAINK